MRRDTIHEIEELIIEIAIENISEIVTEGITTIEIMIMTTIEEMMLLSDEIDSLIILVDTEVQAIEEIMLE
jgi:hypothetical protein